MTLTDQLDRLASFEPTGYPVVSLYLNTQPNQRGRDQYQSFIRKEFKARSLTYLVNSPERQSLDRDVERIAQYLETELQPSANGVAIFACSAVELFEAVQMAAPVDQHWLYIGDQPHLFPLARMASQCPRYAAVLADTNTARIFVFDGAELIGERTVKGVKTRHTFDGGLSQARYQRHIENFHLHHAKEVVDALDRIVHQEGITRILLAGDDVIVPLLREQMPKALAVRIVDHLKLDIHASLTEVISASLGAMTRLNARTDREKVEAAIGGYRAGGLGVVGPEETLSALIKGQVDELLLTARMSDLHHSSPGAEGGAANDSALAEPVVERVSGNGGEAEPEMVRLAEELVAKANQTGARITFIEEASLLADYGGVAALLRFRI